MVERMKLGGPQAKDDGPALEELFASLPVSADWTIGFLTALCSGPDAVALMDWVSVLYPRVEDTPAERGKIDLLARLCGAAGETLRTTPEIIPPEPDKPEQDVVDFCTGYLRGARMHATWGKDETATKKLLPFQVLANEEVVGADAERDRLGRNVAEVYAYWQSRRQVVNATKVGRNDPCPCGSGKKHKKCCLPQA